MSDVDFEERDTSILCYDGFCDSCEDEECQHRCHFRDLRWKRRLESAFLTIGIACVPVALASVFIDSRWWFLLACGAIGVASSFAVGWFEKDWEDESDV
jgi:hypothetical protein